MTHHAWHPAPAPEACEQLAAIPLGWVTRRLLAARGVRGPEDLRAFLAPTLEDLHPPERLLGMPAAVEALARACARRSKITVVGDYDVDGVSATALLTAVLRSLGCDALPLLPNRHAEGYGLQPEHVRRARELGAEMILTADCGVRSLEAAREAARLGLELVVTDHHLPGPTLPQGAIVIDPRQPGCDYPFPDLTGAGLALKLAQALCGRLGAPVPWGSLLRMACLGTIADVAPLLGENRVIVRLGLEELARTPSPGLRELFAEAGVSAPISAADVAFKLGPRLNAPGRLGGAEPALELLLARDPVQARDLAATLGRANAERKALERRILTDCDGRWAASELPPILVAWSAGWHRGVVGVAAGRLARQHGRPTLLFAVDGEIAVGSGRSVENIDLHALLEPWALRAIRFGGHAQAVGLTVPSAALDDLRAACESEALASGLQPEPSRLCYEAELSARDVDSSLLDDLERIAPFGAGNPEPLFRIGPLVAEERRFRRFGSGHLAFTARDPTGGGTFETVGWGWAERAGPWRERFELLGSVERDRYRNAPVVRIVDARPASNENP